MEDRYRIQSLIRRQLDDQEVKARVLRTWRIIPPAVARGYDSSIQTIHQVPPGSIVVSYRYATGIIESPWKTAKARWSRSRQGRTILIIIIESNRMQFCYCFQKPQRSNVLPLRHHSTIRPPCRTDPPHLPEHQRLVFLRDIDSNGIAPRWVESVVIDPLPQYPTSQGTLNPRGSPRGRR